MDLNEQALNFIASGHGEMNAMDNDLASWMMLSGDLLGGVSREHEMFDPHYEEAPHPYPPLEAASRKPVPNNKRKLKATKSAMFPPAPLKRMESVDSDDGNLDPDAKRQRRLEKNREIARNCRKRKRERYGKLEEEVVKLRQWNKQLENQLNQGKDGRDKEVTRQAEIIAMRKLVDTKCSDTEVRQHLTHYKEIYSDFGKERAAAISYHMNQLKSLLIPNTVSKMTLWSLQQDDEFYDEKKNQKTFGGGIWNMLCTELRLTAEQKQSLIDMRHGIRTQRQNVAECIRILKELDQRVNSNFDSMSHQMDSVMDTITPVQQAKFLLWIERNKACTFMLNNMWNPNETSDAGEDGSVPDDSSSTSDSVNTSTFNSSISSAVTSALVKDE